MKQTNINHINEISNTLFVFRKIYYLVIRKMSIVFQVDLDDYLINIVLNTYKTEKTSNYELGLKNNVLEFKRFDSLMISLKTHLVKNDLNKKHVKRKHSKGK